MIWIAWLVVASAAQAQPLPEPRTVRINDRVYVLLGPVQHANRANQGYMINSTVIVGDEGVILVDSGGTAEVGRHIAAAVARITEKRVTHVVNTTTEITTSETSPSRSLRAELRDVPQDGDRDGR